MSDISLLVYVSVTFLVGFACFGAVLVLAQRRLDHLERAFLLFYGALSILVTGRLLLTFVLTVPGESASTRFAMEYVESFVGRYGVMFALPYLAHQVFGVSSRRRNQIVLAITLLAAAGQHLTEFGIGGRYDRAGDVAEDALFAGVVAYTLLLGARHLNEGGVYRPFADRFLLLLVMGLPGIVHDLFLSEGTEWRFYPLWYCVMGVVLTSALVGRRFSVDHVVPVEWGLSQREEEVVLLVRQGLSNREIADALSISTNTVKTHLRAIFDKSGIRTRIGLIARVPAPKSLARPSDSAVAI